jgi:phosphoadenosine phosphosulfate reductase
MSRSNWGRNVLHWCDSCHVPVLAGRCSCGAKTRKVDCTPPADVRPAFPSDIDLINVVYQDHFGAPLVPHGHLVVLNKAPDTDRMEEIVMGGAVVGAIRYRADERRWEPLPRPAAARYLTPETRFVEIDAGAVPSVRDSGASVLAPGLRKICPLVERGDEVFILSPEGNCVGVGRSRLDAATADGMKHGQVVKTRKTAGSACVPGKADWGDAVAANQDILESWEEEAVRFVRETADTHQLPVNVSYSGGKDSLATLLVVRKALGNIPLLFIDTGLEFPETYRNVDQVSAFYGLELVKAPGNSRFWDLFEKLGPPAVNYRWCCSAAKLIPVRNLIRDRWGECLTFIGQRRYESLQRNESSRVFRNRIVGNQVSAAPIHNWTALHVWLYIMREKAPYNPLYACRMDRIGCFMCPSSDLAIIGEIQSRFPELWSRWTARLAGWQQEKNLPSEWITEHQWRTREACIDEANRHC